MESQKLEITNGQGYKLNAYLEIPPNQKPSHYAIFAHCFTCNSNLNAVRHISSALTAYGFGVVRFDFTGLGKSEGSFAESHFSANVTDLVAVHQYTKAHFAAPVLLVGHSLGGAAVIAAAAQLPDVEAIATIGAPASIDHVKKHLSNTNTNITFKTSTVERGEFGCVDHVIPWQIDHQQITTHNPLNNYQPMA